MQTGEAEGIVRALKEVKLADLRAEVAEAALTNELRSGERGKTAQNRLLSLEARCDTLGRMASSTLLIVLAAMSLEHMLRQCYCAASGLPAYISRNRRVSTVEQWTECASS